MRLSIIAFLTWNVNQVLSWIVLEEDNAYASTHNLKMEAVFTFQSQGTT